MIPTPDKIEQEAYKVAHALVARVAALNKDCYERNPELLEFRPDYSRCQENLKRRLEKVFTRKFGVRREKTVSVTDWGNMHWTQGIRSEELTIPGLGQTKVFIRDSVIPSEDEITLEDFKVSLDIEAKEEPIAVVEKKILE